MHVPIPLFCVYARWIHFFSIHALYDLSLTTYMFQCSFWSIRTRLEWWFDPCNRSETLTQSLINYRTRSRDFSIFCATMRTVHLFFFWNDKVWSSIAICWLPPDPPRSHDLSLSSTNFTFFNKLHFLTIFYTPSISTSYWLTVSSLSIQQTHSFLTNGSHQDRKRRGPN